LSLTSSIAVSFTGHEILSSLKGWGSVKTVRAVVCVVLGLCAGGAGLGPAVKTERPQRSEDERS
jgi:hypothetical protein